MKNQRRALFLSHGGGPLPLLGDPTHAELVSRLKDIAASMDRPSAIVVASAHWEERRPTVTSGPHPALIYDYHGFPQEAYEIQYPCPGEPRLARAIAKTLDAAGMAADLDAFSGFDHGMFVPLRVKRCQTRYL